MFSLRQGQPTLLLMLWGAAMEKGYRAPTWMTFKQALACGASVRKGEQGSLVVYASTFSRTEADEATGGRSLPPRRTRSAPQIF